MKQFAFVLVNIVASFLVNGAPFKNLGFENAIKVDIPRYGSGFGGIGELASLVPGWQGSNTAVRYNVIPGELDTLGLFDNHAVAISNYPIIGEFAVAAFAGSLGYTLSQTGDVPSDAKSLRFMFNGDYLDVSINGRPLFIDRQRLLDSGNPSIPKLQYYVAEVEEYAGMEVSLSFRFESPPEYYFKPQVLDDISFSSIKAIPEPPLGILCLLGFGGLWSFSRLGRWVSSRRW